MSKAAIRAFGVLTLVFEAFILLVLIGQRNRLGPFPRRFIISICIFFLATTLIGVGLIFLRKWAALYFSLALVVMPIWLNLASLGEVPLAWNVMVFVFGLVPILPIIIVVRSWSLLSWRGKWFF